jgi:predicted kinase
MGKTLIIIRGIPGSGKSTLAKRLYRSGNVYSADMFFEKDGEYNFDVNKLYLAHRWCKNCVENDMVASAEVIFVANTFVKKKSLKEYYKLANTYDYEVFSIIVENRHLGVNVHDVSTDILNEMKDKFDIQL